MEAGLRDEGVAQAVSTWLAITRPCVSTPVLPKKKKKYR
jgi:hypothetical protein